MVTVGAAQNEFGFAVSAVVSGRDGLPSPGPRRDLDQWFTHAWAADALVRRFFPDLGVKSRVVDAGCGGGVFLKAVPEGIAAVGVDIDGAQADIARQNTGRDVIVGDFCSVELPWQPTDVVGNPPFTRVVAEGFLQRAARELPHGGRCGFVLPASFLSFSSTAAYWRERFSIRQEALPRDLFPRIRVPLSFYLFEKDELHRMYGFALFEEAELVAGMPRRLRAMLRNGAPRRRTWAAVVEEAMRLLGGETSLDGLYQLLFSNRPSHISTWKDTVRRELQEGPYKNVARGRWRMLASP